MRFMVMHKVDANMESGGPPSARIVSEMGRLVGQGLESGVFLDGAGLHRSALRVRLRFVGGRCEVTRGPFAGDNELVTSFAMIKAPSMEAAIEQAGRLAGAIGDAPLEIEIGPVVEAWDLGLMPKPEGLERGRFLLLRKADASAEAGAPPPPATAAAIDKLLAELEKTGVLLTARRLKPSARGARLAAGPKGKRTWIDGPFTESKELIAGFSILEVPSKADAIAWANEYADILEGNEVDLRELPDDDAPAF